MHFPTSKHQTMKTDICYTNFKQKSCLNILIPYKISTVTHINIATCNLLDASLLFLAKVFLLLTLLFRDTPITILWPMSELQFFVKL